MNKTILTLTMSVLAGSSYLTPAHAQNAMPSAPMPAMTTQASAQEVTTPMDQDIAMLQGEWAKIKYQISDKDSQLEAIHALEEQASNVSAKYPDKAEPKIWEGIILSTDAGIVKGMSALGKVKKAKQLFETSIQENPDALNGSAHTSLGSLYYQVPGWPIGFGDNDEAEKHLKEAIQMNPDGIDPNYFYGDFLLQDGRYSEAKTYLSHALEAPDRPGRELADAGRRQEIKAALAQVEQKLNDGSGSKYRD